ncbi:protein SSX1-like [Peromyscus eremicus]|uniref:protein SSX1-like n=1 Tax=Peromyscus eremicus TaxID=42410 RepID=UPI0027DD27BC|nr:protein SSX1-like [Peromyscus eremicus]
MVSFQNPINSTDMKTVSSCVKSSVEETCEPKNICEAIKDISTYFTEEEWAKLTKWQKSAYVYMKRNYIRMTGLGVTVNQPVFMRCKEQAKEKVVECTKVHGREEGHPEESYDMKQIKRLKLTPLTIDLYDIKDRLTFGGVTFSTVSILPGGRFWINPWRHRLRERKNRVIYEEISDPEESDDDDD